MYQASPRGERPRDKASSITCLDIRFAAYLNVLAGVIGKDFTGKISLPASRPCSEMQVIPPSFPVASSSKLCYCPLHLADIYIIHEIIIQSQLGIACIFISLFTCLLSGSNGYTCIKSISCLQFLCKSSERDMTCVILTMPSLGSMGWMSLGLVCCGTFLYFGVVISSSSLVLVPF